MSKGIAKTVPLGTIKGVAHTETHQWEFLYQTSTSRDTRWYPGDRALLPDGRVFRYCKEHTSSHVSAALIESGRGVKFLGEINGVNVLQDGVATTVSVAQDVGDSTLSWATQTFEKDILRGGYVSINHDSHHMQAGVIGNDACSASTLKIYLDRKLTTHVEVGDFGTLLPNPYLFVGRDGDSYNSCAGIPMSTPAAGAYFWVQTWGPCWLNPGPYTIGDEVQERRVVFNPDGSLRIAAAGNITWQTAGFVMDMTGVGKKARMFMLQISP